MYQVSKGSPLGDKYSHTRFQSLKLYYYSSIYKPCLKMGYLFTRRRLRFHEFTEKRESSHKLLKNCRFPISSTVPCVSEQPPPRRYFQNTHRLRYIEKKIQEEKRNTERKAIYARVYLGNITGDELSTTSKCNPRVRGDRFRLEK